MESNQMDFAIVNLSYQVRAAGDHRASAACGGRRYRTPQRQIAKWFLDR